jgi:hypothetical protein
MATPRRPLQEISSNSTIRKELSPYQRGILVGASRAGAKLSEISQALSIPKSTIYNTLKIDLERDNGKSKLEPAGHSLILVVMSVKSYDLYAYHRNQHMTTFRRNVGLICRPLHLKGFWRSIVSRIGELKSDQPSQRRQPGRGISGVKYDDTGLKRTSWNTCRVTSARQSGVKARRESGYSVRQPRNGRKRWSQPIKRERISWSWSGHAFGGHMGVCTSQTL